MLSFFMHNFVHTISKVIKMAGRFFSVCCYIYARARASWASLRRVELQVRRFSADLDFAESGARKVSMHQRSRAKMVWNIVQSLLLVWYRNSEALPSFSACMLLFSRPLHLQQPFDRFAYIQSRQYMSIFSLCTFARSQAFVPLTPSFLSCPSLCIRQMCPRVPS